MKAKKRSRLDRFLRDAANRPSRYKAKEEIGEMGESLPEFLSGMIVESCWNGESDCPKDGCDCGPVVDHIVKILEEK